MLENLNRTRRAFTPLALRPLDTDAEGSPVEGSSVTGEFAVPPIVNPIVSG